MSNPKYNNIDNNGLIYILETLKSDVNEINASLEPKIDKDDLISEINASADVINLTGNRFVVDSDNFKLTEDGTVTANNVNLTGTINADSGKIGDFAISKSLFTNIDDMYDDMEVYNARSQVENMPNSFCISEEGISNIFSSHYKISTQGIVITDDYYLNTVTMRDGNIVFTTSRYDAKNNSQDSPYAIIFNGHELGISRDYAPYSGEYSYDGYFQFEYNGDFSPSNNILIGDKLKYHDGESGIYLARDGFMHIQRGNTSYDPYIEFIRGSNTVGYSLLLTSNNKFRFTTALELNGHNIDTVGQQGIWSADMSNYIVRYYVSGTTKCTALGNNDYATRIYGSSVWANKTISTSDEKLKTDFRSLDMMNVFMELEPVSFRWKQDYEDGDNLIHFGLKAGQVKITFEKYGYNTDDYSVIGNFGGYMGICYDDLFMLTMCATQKNTKELMYQAGKIDLHETIVKDLQNRILQLEKQVEELKQAVA